MVVHKHTNVVGIGNDTVRETRVGAPPTNVDTGAAEGGVGEVTVVDERSAVLGNPNAVLSDVWRVFWSVKLHINGGREGREIPGELSILHYPDKCIVNYLDLQVAYATVLC